MQLYSLKEAEDLTGFSDKTLRRYIKQKKLEATFSGNQYRIKGISLAPYIKHAKVEQVYADDVAEEEISKRDLIRDIRDTYEVMSNNQGSISSDHRAMLESYERLMSSTMDKVVEKDKKEIMQLMQETGEKILKTVTSNVFELLTQLNPDMLTTMVKSIADNDVEQFINMLCAGTDKFVPSDAPELIRQTLKTYMQKEYSEPARLLLESESA